MWVSLLLGGKTNIFESIMLKNLQANFKAALLLCLKDISFYPELVPSLFMVGKGHSYKGKLAFFCVAFNI